MDPHDVHDPGEIVGQNVQRHLGGDLWQRLHQEVGSAHPAAVKVEILEQVPCAGSCDFSKLPQALICAGAVFLFNAVLDCVTAVSAADRDLAVPPGYSALRPGAADEIRAVEEEIDRIEAATLALYQISLIKTPEPTTAIQLMRQG